MRWGSLRKRFIVFLDRIVVLLALSVVLLTFGHDGLVVYVSAAAIVAILDAWKRKNCLIYTISFNYIE